MRERNRLTAMHAIQARALDLFDGSGYAAVTVEDVAAAAGVSASTIYRYFGTKERLILWDEYDQAVAAALADRLRREKPLDALRSALVQVLGSLYDGDDEMLLHRVRLMHAQPEVRAAALAKGFADQQELAAAFRTLPKQPLSEIESQMAASVGMAALDVAVAEWQRRDGIEPLARLLDAAFAAVRRL